MGEGVAQAKKVWLELGWKDAPVQRLDVTGAVQVRGSEVFAC